MTARVSVYERDGQYQLYIEHVDPKGTGALQLAFEQLKARLHKEGLFDEERKKPLPFLPQTIGVVTSATGAVIRDIIQREEQVRLRITSEYIYVNDTRVPMDTQTAGTYLYLIDEISRRGTESIEFHEEVEPGELGVFLQIFFQLEEGDGVFDDLQSAMLEMSIHNIDVHPWIDRERTLTETLFDQKNIRKRSREVFYRTVHMMSEKL